MADNMIASYVRMDYIKDTLSEKDAIENIKNFITAISHHVLIFFEKHEQERV